LVLSALRNTGDGNLYVGEVVADHLFEVPLHFICKNVILPLRVVGLAVIPDQLDVIQSLLNSAVLSTFELILNLEEIHRMLYYEGIVVEF
jgi:hypothetical protein